jgi:hypothetical protein
MDYTASFSSLAGRNAIFLLAAIFIDAPVAGFRPIRAGSARTCRMPSPVSRILSPCFRYRAASATRSPNTDSATFFGRSWSSANSAAICLSVMVTCGANRRRSRLLGRRGSLLRPCGFLWWSSFLCRGGYLGGRSGFLRWQHDDLLRTNSLGQHARGKPIRTTRTMPGWCGITTDTQAGISR